MRLFSTNTPDIFIMQLEYIRCICGKRSIDRHTHIPQKVKAQKNNVTGKITILIGFKGTSNYSFQIGRNLWLDTVFLNIMNF